MISYLSSTDGICRTFVTHRRSCSSRLSFVTSVINQVTSTLPLEALIGASLVMIPSTSADYRQPSVRQLIPTADRCDNLGAICLRSCRCFCLARVSSRRSHNWEFGAASFSVLRVPLRMLATNPISDEEDTRRTLSHKFDR